MSIIVFLFMDWATDTECLRTPNDQFGVLVTYPPYVYIEAQEPHFKSRVLIIDLPDPIVQFNSYEPRPSTALFLKL